MRRGGPDAALSVWVTQAEEESPLVSPLADCLWWLCHPNPQSGFWATPPYSNWRNSSTVSPASCTIPPNVNAWIGLCRGIVT